MVMQCVKGPPHGTNRRLKRRERARPVDDAHWANHIRSGTYAAPGCHSGDATTIYATNLPSIDNSIRQLTEPQDTNMIASPPSSALPGRSLGALFAFPFAFIFLATSPA